MASNSRIIDLARSIAEHAAVVDAYLQENGLSERTESSDINSPPWMPIPDTTAEQSRQKTMAACQELRGLVGGPVLPLVVDWTRPVILRLIIQLRLADLVPLQPAPGAAGTPFASVAAATRPQLGESYVRRILRHAATHGIFCEPSQGLVAHTLTSALLVRSPPVKDLVMYGMLDMLPAGMRLGDALQRFPGSLDPKDTGSALANLDRDLAFVDAAAEDGDTVIALSRRKSLWQIHSQEPEVARRFHAAMTHEFTDEDALLSEFFGETRIEGQTIVDVGGGRGAMSVEAAGKAPTARFVVQDSEENCEKGQESLPPELRERVRFMAQ
ncbi:Chlorophenol O-methyltransferase [Colletotrichum liriopes]|uniref:Chlorophenol O-methyltransferase n=1 Tax=Colletotrichum liriopes TaxID=708192 RepID=A0AA37H084_9PEZI|nr:Chlorophenol O-methyltransferase [Colletotrichum liriopes]